MLESEFPNGKQWTRQVWAVLFSYHGHFKNESCSITPIFARFPRFQLKLPMTNTFCDAVESLYGEKLLQATLGIVMTK